MANDKTVFLATQPHHTHAEPLHFALQIKSPDWNILGKLVKPICKWNKDVSGEMDKVQHPHCRWSSAPPTSTTTITTITTTGAEKQNMSLNRCTCAISKCTDSDRQSRWESADDVTGEKIAWVAGGGEGGRGRVIDRDGEADRKGW